MKSLIISLFSSLCRTLGNERGGANAVTWPTLIDVARRLDPNGSIAKVSEILNNYNEIMDDLPFVEGNLPTGHKTTLRASLPHGTWRSLNQGIQPLKSTTKQIEESCGMLEARSEIDVDVAKLNGNTAAWRLSEEAPVIEGIGQDLTTEIIYGDTSVHSERFIGLAARYYSKSASVTTSKNVLDAGGTTNLSSIWLVGWSPETIHGIFPKGSQAGLFMQDLGEQTVYTDGATLNRMQAYCTRYQFKAGIAVRDWRYIVRIANIDMTALLTAGDANDTSANILKYMSMALDKFPPVINCRPVFYMAQDVRAMLRVKLMSKSNTFLTLEDWKSPTGISRPTLTFQGVPCRRVDAITSSETQIT